MKPISTPFQRRDQRLILYFLGGPVTVLLVWMCLAPVDVSVRARGIVRPYGEPVRIASETAGRIRDILVHQGSDVQAGSVLVQLHTRDFLAREKTLETRIHLMELQSYRANAVKAARLRARLSALYQNLEENRLNLGRLTITSPVDGRVTSLMPLQVDELLPAAITVAEITPRENLVVESWIRSTDRGYVKPGQRVHLRSESFPSNHYNVFEGVVLQVSPERRSNEPVMYRVLITPSPYSLEMGVGSSFEVRFGTRRERLIGYLWKNVF